MQIRIIEVRDRAAMDQVWALRRCVFIEEQRVPEELELDGDDDRALHVLALDQDSPVGCGRMIPDNDHVNDHVKIGRMAVLSERRGEGIGRRILEHLMNAARRQGFRKAILHAQLHAEGFYLKCGFIPQGDTFMEAGIVHRLMEHEL